MAAQHDVDMDDCGAEPGHLCGVCPCVALFLVTAMRIGWSMAWLSIMMARKARYQMLKTLERLFEVVSRH